jgi:hypothetical protein
VFLQLSSTGLFGVKRAYLYLETPKVQEVFLSKLSQFSKENNVLHTLASNRDGFLSRDTCVSSTQVDRPLWSNMGPSPP